MQALMRVHAHMLARIVVEQALSMWSRTMVDVMYNAH
jgi:hypothetical protein